MSFQIHESFFEMEDDEKRKYLFDEKEILKFLFKVVSNF